MGRFLGIAAALFCFLFIAGPAASAYLNDGEIVELINRYRRVHNLKPLKENLKLKLSSRLKVKDMASHGYFSHAGSNGEAFHLNVRKANYTYRAIAEILALNGPNERLVFEAWVNSARHRATIMDPDLDEISCSNGSSRSGAYVACHLGRSNR